MQLEKLTKVDGSVLQHRQLYGPAWISPGCYYPLTSPITEIIGLDLLPMTLMG